MDTLNHPVVSVNTPIDIEDATPEQQTAYFNALKEWADLNTYTPANRPPNLPPIEYDQLTKSEAVKFAFATSHTYCFPQPKPEHEIQKQSQLIRMRNQAEAIANKASKKDIDFLSPVKSDRPSAGRLIIQRQGSVLRVKTRRAGEDTGRVFGNGWNARPDSDNDLLSEYPSDFVNSHYQPPKKRGNKNAISGFSAASRRNLVDKFLSLQRHMWLNAKFLTLTYHEDFGSPSDAKKHLRALFKRIYRYCDRHNRRSPENAYKPCCFWRMELKERLSGEHKGQVAPHFHCFLFQCPYIPHSMLLEWWREITDDESISQVKVERLDNYRKAMNYVAKYVAKREKKAAETDLDISLYLAVVGRFWGFEGGENIAFDNCREVNLPVLTPALQRFIQVCAGFYPHVKNRQSGSSSGFRIFEFDEGGLAWLEEALDECLWPDDLSGGDIEF